MTARAATGRYPYLNHRTVAEVDRAARRWCDQCEARVTGAAAAACRSPWCRLRGGGGG